VFLRDFLIWALGASVSVFANVVYYDMRRKGVRGFSRFAAFIAGNPLTWVTLLAVKEGRAEDFRPPPDDDERLLREVRMDRELRGLPPVADLAPARRSSERGEEG
jgi:hypothetical protein